MADTAGSRERRGHDSARTVLAVVGAVVAILAAVGAAAPALGGLEWGSDSGPFPVIAGIVPAVASAGLVRAVTAGRAAGVRPTAAVAVSALGLVVWLVAVVAAFETQSAYTSTEADADLAAGWVVAGGLGALVAVAGAALLPRRVSGRAWAAAAVLVAVVWLGFGIVRSVANNAVLPI